MAIKPLIRPYLEGGAIDQSWQILGEKNGQNSPSQIEDWNSHPLSLYTFFCLKGKEFFKNPTASHITNPKPILQNHHTQVMGPI